MASSNNSETPVPGLPILAETNCPKGGSDTCSCAEVGNNSARGSKRAAGNSVLSILLSIGVAFFPKCPFCWAGYMSLFGIASLESIPYTPWLKPVMVVALGINLLVLYRMSRARKFHLPFYFSCAGATLILLGSHADAGSLATQGLAFIIFGAVLNAIRADALFRRLTTIA